MKLICQSTRLWGSWCFESGPGIGQLPQSVSLWWWDEECCWALAQKKWRHKTVSTFSARLFSHHRLDKLLDSRWKTALICSLRVFLDVCLCFLISGQVVISWGNCCTWILGLQQLALVPGEFAGPKGGFDGDPPGAKAKEASERKAKRVVNGCEWYY